jgi:hypothetical protein
MQVAARYVCSGAMHHGKPIQGAPSKETEGECCEVEMRRAQNRLPTDPKELTYAQKIPTPDEPQAAFPKTDMACSARAMTSIVAPRPATLTQRQPFPQCQEPQGNRDTLPEWMKKWQQLRQHSSRSCSP